MKYPDLNPKMDVPLKAYLIMAVPGEQVWINAYPKDILTEIPAMLIDSNIKTKTLALLARSKRLKLLDKADPGSEQLVKEVNQLALQLQYDKTCQIEIRFKDLNYGLIWKLQVDDLIDRDLTPQGKASIRIILGTLGRFIPGKGIDEQQHRQDTL